MIQSSVDQMFIYPWLELNLHLHFVIFSVYICVNSIHWLHCPCARSRFLPHGQDPFLLCRSDSACVPRPSSETNHPRPSQVMKPRWQAPSKYPCPPEAGLQDWATSSDVCLPCFEPLTELLHETIYLQVANLQVLRQLYPELNQKAWGENRASPYPQSLIHTYSRRNKTCRLYVKVCDMFPFR